MVGATRSRRLVARLRELRWGRIFVGKPTPYPGEPWALDNGAFSAWRSGKQLDPLRFAERARRFAPLGPRFGVLPDIVGDGPASLELSLQWVDRLPVLPWYLAVQDGMTPAMVEPALARVAGLFLGGTTAFKGSAPTWSNLAHAHGRAFHYGRASTPKHIGRAVDCGADSCDSSQPLWSESEWRKFERAVFLSTRQIRLYID